MKFVIIITLLCATSILAKTSSRSGDPAYHVPLVHKSSSPLDITFHHRLDMLNAPSRVKRAYLDAADKKVSLRSELARQFTTKALNDWVTHLAGQNLNLVHKGEFFNDITNLKGFAKLLRSHIIAKSNAVMDKMALMDLKLKEQKLIEQEIEGIRVHPGNISSNLGTNLPWKERLEEIVNNAASIHTEFDVALNGMCNVIQRIHFFVNNMHMTYMDSKKIRQPLPETQYYPNEYVNVGNRPSFPPLGPEGGKYNEKDPLMNGDLPFPHPGAKPVPRSRPPTRHQIEDHGKKEKAKSKEILEKIAQEDQELEHKHHKKHSKKEERRRRR